MFRSTVGELTVDEALVATLSAAGEVLPRVEDLVLFVWRRQFSAAVRRSLVAARQDGMPLLAIGFLDLVDFTSSARRWDAARLGRTLERFERDTPCASGPSAARSSRRSVTGSFSAPPTLPRRCASR